MQYDHEKTALCLLETLYELARSDVPATPETLASWLDAPKDRVRDLLIRLDAQGLVDHDRCRLTMRGLVLAVSIAGSRKLARQPAAA